MFFQLHFFILNISNQCNTEIWVFLNIRSNVAGNKIAPECEEKMEQNLKHDKFVFFRSFILSSPQKIRAR